jgi:hypothetical protein
MNHTDLESLADLLGKMKPGPYEYWDQKHNDLLAAECTKAGEGKLIAALPGLSGMENEFRAIAALLNAAPDLLRLARIGLDSENRELPPL